MSHGAVVLTPFGQASDARFALDVSKEVAGEVADVGLGGVYHRAVSWFELFACDVWNVDR